MPGSRRRTEGRSSAARRRKQPPAFDPTRSPTPFFGEPMRLAFLSSTNSIKHSSPDSPRVAFNYKRVPTHLGWHSHPPEGAKVAPGVPLVHCAPQMRTPGTGRAKGARGRRVHTNEQHRAEAVVTVAKSHLGRR